MSKSQSRRQKKSQHQRYVEWRVKEQLDNPFVTEEVSNVRPYKSMCRTSQYQEILALPECSSPYVDAEITRSESLKVLFILCIVCKLIVPYG